MTDRTDPWRRSLKELLLVAKNDGVASQAAGKPVVATRVGGVPELIIDGSTGILVPPENDEELARALETLLSNADLRGRMGTAGLDRTSMFSWTAIADQYETLYEGVLCDRS